MIELKSNKKKIESNKIYKLGSMFLRSAKYSIITKKLTVEMRNGKKYIYYNVSKNMVNNFINNKNCSSFFSVVKKNRKFKAT